MPIIKKECLPSGTNYINGTVVKIKKNICKFTNWNLLTILSDNLLSFAEAKELKHSRGVDMVC